MELETSLNQSKEKGDQQVEEIERLQAALSKVDEEKAFLEADYKYKKDAYTNFAYYNAFTDAIWAHLRSDPNGNITTMVEELAKYVRGNPSDAMHFLEIHDLANLGVDLSFFSDQEQVGRPLARPPRILCWFLLRTGPPLLRLRSLLSGRPLGQEVLRSSLKESSWRRRPGRS